MEKSCRGRSSIMKSSLILNYSFWQECNQMVIATNKEQHVKNKSFTHKGRKTNNSPLMEDQQDSPWPFGAENYNNSVLILRSYCSCVTDESTLSGPGATRRQSDTGWGQIIHMQLPWHISTSKGVRIYSQARFLWTCGIMEIYPCMYFISECKTDKNRYTCERACAAVTSQQVNLDCQYLQFKGVSRHFQTGRTAQPAFHTHTYTHTTVTQEFTSQITSWSHPIRFFWIF